MLVQQNKNTQLNIKTPQTIKDLPQPKRQALLNAGPTPSFKGLGSRITTALKFLDTKKALGAMFVDLAFMVIPRTIIDFSRGMDAGIETGRRESTSTTNHALLGTYGLAAGGMAAYAFNKKYNIKAHKLFTSDENLDILGKAMHEQIHVKKSTNPISDYIDDIVAKIKGFNPKNKTAEAWKFLDIDTQKEIAKKLKAELKNEKLNKETMEYLNALITKSIGAESILKIDGAKDSLALNILMDSIHKVSRTFENNNVQNAFKEVSKFSENAFIKGLKRLNTKTAIIGLGFASIIGMMVQPLNMYLTKRKTGKEGFVGVDGREPDKSTNFKIMKNVAGLGFMGMALSMIGKITSPKEILNKVQFRGTVPTISQFKLIYGATIMTRLFSARDKNELRESLIKDSLGILNWLILGNFVAKLTAAGFEKFNKDVDSKLINYSESESENGKGFFKWLIKSTLKTRDEILQTALKKTNIDTIKDGKALPFKELLKLAAEHAPSASKKIKYLNIAQLMGYLYSGLALGIGIPKLNIFITNRVEGKKKQEANITKKNTLTNKQEIPKTFEKITGHSTEKTTKVEKTIEKIETEKIPKNEKLTT